METPVDILNSMMNEDITERDVVRWACDQMSANERLATNEFWFDLAVLRENDAEELSRVESLLRRLIAESVDFSISAESLAKYRQFADDCRSAERKTVSISEFWPLILGALPEVIPLWENHLTTNHGYRVGLYSDECGVLIKHTLQQIRDDNHTRLSNIADVIELAITRGDDDCRNVAVVGFVESITNICGHKPESLPVERLVSCFGDATLHSLHELDRFWGTHTPES